MTRRRGFLGFLSQVWAPVWRYFVTGLLVWVPLIITIWVSWVVIKNLGIGLDKAFKTVFEAIQAFCERVDWLSIAAPLFETYPGMGFMTAIALFLGTGILARYLIGRRIIAFGERILDRIPLISRVYRAVQQIRDVFVSREGTVFQYTCLIEYPREGMIALAFVTSAEQGIVQKTTGRKLVAVFVPTTPNPTSGYLVYLPPEDITILDVSVEEAMKLIVSGGAYLPSKHAIGVKARSEESTADDEPA